MPILDTIWGLIRTISDWFWGASETTGNWVYPFNLLSWPLYYISDAFWKILDPFAMFIYWCEQVWENILEILHIDDIIAFFADFIEMAVNAWNWVVNAWNNILGVVGAWWTTISTVVKGWIDIAIQLVRDIIDNVSVVLNGLITIWNSFVADILPTLANWTGVHNLIDSTLRDWFPWYNILSDLIGEIGEFFSNPFDYLVNKLEDWFWGGS